MSYKHYVPTFRARWQFLQATLASLGRVDRALHVGCGEGDHDLPIKARCEVLVACDLNAADVDHARALHCHVPGIEYRVEDATALSLPGATFDLIVCIDVIEHVADPQRLLSEIARLLTVGGRCILTCPSAWFPVTYDPINFMLERFGIHLPLGAYAYGHSWLVREAMLEGWLRDLGLYTLREQRLTRWLAGALECYWVGFLHRALKPNARNTGEPARGLVRPSANTQPWGIELVDALVSADAQLGANSRRSVGLGYLLERRA